LEENKNRRCKKMISRNYIKKNCGFYISEWHFVTMLLPHIVNEVENGIKVETLLNKNIKKEINEVLSKLNINNFTKARVLNINWDNIDNNKFDFKKNYMDEIIKNNDKIEFLVNGKKDEIDNINKNLEYWLDINIDKIKNKDIDITNCYEISEFNSNINKILDEHDYIINTSGKYPVEEMFESHRKKAV
jgi:hypothetical protein